MTAERSASLSFRLTLLIILTTLGASAVMTIVGYRIYLRNMENKYIALGRNLTATVAEFLDGESVEGYLETLTADEAYDDVLDLMRVIARNNDIKYLYVVRFAEDGSHFVFDADVDGFPLGYVDPWNEGFEDAKKQDFYEGRDIPPEIYNSNVGRVFTIHTPLRYRSGQTAKGCYVAADFSMDSLIRERRQYFGLLAALAIVVSVFFALTHRYIVRRSVVAPVNRMVQAIREFLVGGGQSSLSTLSVQTGDELQMLAESLKDMERKIGDHVRNLNEARNQAEAASIAKSSFLATMSHEIRTPLNAIIGFAEILLHKELPDTITEDLEKIYSSGAVLLGIINDILDISKIESGNLDLSPVRYNVPSLVNDTINLNLIRIGSKPIAFSLEIDETIPAVLLGDELRVKQILNNLLSNAIKYTQAGKVILQISWKPLEEKAGILLTFRVSDTGQGIRAADLGKLFSQYRQLNTQANRSIEGTGLGLAITKILAELMGGSIAVESRFGRGSVFTVSLRQDILDPNPIGRETADNLMRFRFVDSRRDRQSMIRTRMPEGRVLVVDDVQTNIDVARGLMLSYGLTIDGVKSGEEAIALIRAAVPQYDVIFMDHMMPGMDGLEASAMIRRIDSDYAREIPIIALTANALAGSRELFLQSGSGINDFLAKPIDIQKLTAVLERWIPPEKQSRNRALVPEDAGVPFLISGVDSRTGVANAGGDVEAYKRILRMFCTDAEERIPRIQAAAAEADLGLYTTAVHAMKGAAWSIGAMEFGDLASLMEEAGRKGDTKQIAEQTGELLEHLMMLKDAITLALGEEGGSGEQDYSALELAVLREALVNMDTESVNQQLLKYGKLALGSREKALVSEIEQFILLFEYDKAVERIDRLVYNT